MLMLLLIMGRLLGAAFVAGVTLGDRIRRLNSLEAWQRIQAGWMWLQQRFLRVRELAAQVETQLAEIHAGVHGLRRGAQPGPTSALDSRIFNIYRLDAVGGGFQTPRKLSQSDL
jgi:hypothetical protein